MDPALSSCSLLSLLGESMKIYTSMRWKSSLFNMHYTWNRNTCDSAPRPMYTVREDRDHLAVVTFTLTRTFTHQYNDSDWLSISNECVQAITVCIYTNQGDGRDLPSQTKSARKGLFTLSKIFFHPCGLNMYTKTSIYIHSSVHIGGGLYNCRIVFVDPYMDENFHEYTCRAYS